MSRYGGDRGKSATEDDVPGAKYVFAIHVQV